VVADGGELAERKIRRVFWTDPALSVACYEDAGYDEATRKTRKTRKARKTGLDLGAVSPFR
jgi:urocanate hydratase